MSRPFCFRIAFVCLLLSLCVVSGSATAQSNETYRSWNQPVEPLRIIDNVYYVGANDIAAYLITGDDGHVLIDGGFPETAEIIRDSVAKLGFELKDVQLLLNSHAHFDHAGGLAALVEWTGAEVVISTLDAPVISSGGAGDYFISAEENAFPAVEVARQVDDGDTVDLGDISLTANITAGHTKGCTSWSMEVKDADSTPQTVVFVCSLSLLPGVELLGNPAYPNIVEDFRASFERLRSLSGDVFLAAHTRFFDLEGKAARVGEGVNPFIDPDGYFTYVERSELRFERILAEQKAALEAGDGAPVLVIEPAEQSGHRHR